MSASESEVPASGEGTPSSRGRGRPRKLKTALFQGDDESSAGYEQSSSLPGILSSAESASNMGDAAPARKTTPSGRKRGGTPSSRKGTPSSRKGTPSSRGGGTPRTPKTPKTPGSGSAFRRTAPRIWWALNPKFQIPDGPKHLARCLNPKQFEGEAD